MIPVAASVMETQPVWLVLLLLASAFAGQNAAPLLDPVSITLLLSGLQWWGMLVHYLVRQRNVSVEWAEVVSISGLCLAFTLALLTHLQLLNAIAALVVVAGLVVWFWRRGLRLARLERSDEYLITSFKVGFIVVLVVLAISAVYFSPSTLSYLPYTALHEATARGLIIYFFSGVLCLSLARVSFIRREHVYRASSGSAPHDPTRLWLAILLLFWTAITAAAFALETFSFGAITTVVTWLWNGLGALLDWLFSLLVPLLAFLLHLFAPLFPPMITHSTTAPRTSTISHPTQPPQLPADVLNLIRLLLLLALLTVAILVIRAILRRLRWHADEESEEERESLSMQSILREQSARRRKSRQKDEEVALDPLAPDSIRARYRDLLQALSEQGASLAHRPAETPSEYEARLLALLKASAQEDTDGALSDATLLQQLTHAYIQERYGEKRSQLAHDASLPAWIARFVKRLAGNTNV